MEILARLGKIRQRGRSSIKHAILDFIHLWTSCIDLVQTSSSRSTIDTALTLVFLEDDTFLIWADEHAGALYLFKNAAIIITF